MLRKIYLIAILVLTSSFAMAQSGSLKGVITDAMSGEPVPFANIVIEKNGNQSAGATTDFDGNYTIKPVEPGTYTIKSGDLTTKSFTTSFSATGFYNVTLAITNDFGNNTKNVESFFAVSTTQGSSIKEYGASNLASLYPNPTSNMVQIVLSPSISLSNVYVSLYCNNCLE